MRSDRWVEAAIAQAAGFPGLVVTAAAPRQQLLAGYETDQVDLWVYTAGDIISSKVEEMTPAVWQRILDANLTGAFLAAHYSLPLLAPEAHLFFLGAVSERMQLPSLAAYAAAKAGWRPSARPFARKPASAK